MWVDCRWYSSAASINADNWVICSTCGHPQPTQNIKNETSSATPAHTPFHRGEVNHENCYRKQHQTDVILEEVEHAPLRQVFALLKLVHRQADLLVGHLAVPLLLVVEV